jgi:hypothetical protein
VTTSYNSLCTYHRVIFWSVFFLLLYFFLKTFHRTSLCRDYSVFRICDGGQVVVRSRFLGFLTQPPPGLVPISVRPKPCSVSDSIRVTYTPPPSHFHSPHTHLSFCFLCEINRELSRRLIIMIYTGFHG